MAESPVLSADVDIVDNLARLTDAIGEAAVRAGRHVEDITLVGISKTQPVPLIAAAIQAGLRHIGENRVQEAAEKFPALRRAIEAIDPAPAEPICHMVGHLQSNKAASALALFDRVDSVDSLRVAQALSRHIAGSDRTLPVLLEVYAGEDPQRPGLRPDELVEIAGQIMELPGLRVEGLMTIAPLGGDAAAAFQHVRNMKQRLSEAFSDLYFGVLSMGMSEDYPLAIAEGSTEIRIGSALFGPRKPR